MDSFPTGKHLLLHPLDFKAPRYAADGKLIARKLIRKLVRKHRQKGLALCTRLSAAPYRCGRPCAPRPGPELTAINTAIGREADRDELGT